MLFSFFFYSSSANGLRTPKSSPYPLNARFFFQALLLKLPIGIFFLDSHLHCRSQWLNHLIYIPLNADPLRSGLDNSTSSQISCLPWSLLSTRRTIFLTNIVVCYEIKSKENNIYFFLFSRVSEKIKKLN